MIKNIEKFEATKEEYKAPDAKPSWWGGSRPQEDQELERKKSKGLKRTVLQLVGIKKRMALLDEQIAESEKQIAEGKEKIIEHDKQIAERDKQIIECDNQIIDCDEQIAALNKRIASIDETISRTILVMGIRKEHLGAQHRVILDAHEHFVKRYYDKLVEWEVKDDLDEMLAKLKKWLWESDLYNSI